MMVTQLAFQIKKHQMGAWITREIHGQTVTAKRQEVLAPCGNLNRTAKQQEVLAIEMGSERWRLDPIVKCEIGPYRP